MKKTLSVLFVIAIVIAACNNKKPKDGITITDKDGKEQVTIDPEKMKDAAADMEKIKEELGNLTPLSADKLKAMVPEQLMGAAVSNADVSDAAGASVASGDYKINDSTDVKLTIIDCAGPGGAGIYGLQYLGMLNVQQEDGNEMNKTIDFKGAKAFEHCDKEANECSFTYFAGGRFLVTLEGENVSIDGLKQAAKGLDIK